MRRIDVSDWHWTPLARRHAHVWSIDEQVCCHDDACVNSTRTRTTHTATDMSQCRVVIIDFACAVRRMFWVKRETRSNVYRDPSVHVRKVSLFGPQVRRLRWHTNFCSVLIALMCYYWLLNNVTRNCYYSFVSKLSRRCRDYTTFLFCESSVVCCQ